VSDPVSYTAVLPIGTSTAAFLSGLLAAERARRGTRDGRRALDCHGQAVLVLRWFIDGTRVAQLALDNQISESTAYRYLHEAIDVLADAAPALQGALLAARVAGYTHVQLDGTLIRTDRCKAVGPTAKVDLWWCSRPGPTSASDGGTTGRVPTAGSPRHRPLRRGLHRRPAAGTR
jgi:hypothetical protein